MPHDTLMLFWLQKAFEAMILPLEMLFGGMFVKVDTVLSLSEQRP